MLDRIYLNMDTQIGLFKNNYDTEFPFVICLKGKEIIRVNNFRDAYIEYNVAIREFKNKIDAHRVPSYR